MIRLLRILGQIALGRFAQIGRASIMWGSALNSLPKTSDARLFIDQIYVIGVKSLILIVMSAFSIGAVLALQFYTQLVRFGAEEAVGVGVAMVLLRELGPVVTALLFAGRAGSAITAEIGLMNATDQLSSMEMMGVDPLKRIVAPRLWAGFFCLPMLAIIFSAVGIWSSGLVGVDWLGIESVGFWAGMLDTVELWEDIGKGIVKTLVFALIVTWIAVFQGYDSEPTSEGISSATTRTVIFSSVAVLTLDFFLTLVMYGDF
ncbi:MAG: lipid asymmetry maintenance ABC transporter permease subunit MlaE [Pseudomonadales bacterium]|nr:lipid asymmetry maintenance ABC transporter permease subunit MlaE [Pseudomonadales bacterium]